MNDQWVWRKARRSGGEGGDCVEVAEPPTGGFAVRDSKDRSGPYLRFTAPGWSAFITAIRSGEFG